MQTIGRIVINGRAYKALLRAGKYHNFVRRGRGAFKEMQPAPVFEAESQYLNENPDQATKFLNYETVRC